MTPRIAAVSLAILISLPAGAATRMTYDINGQPTAIEWAPTAFPLRYDIDRRLHDLDASLPAAIERAFGSWSSIPETSVRFQGGVVEKLVRQRDDGRIAVSVAESLFRDQGALALTTYTFDATGRFTDADILIDPALLKGSYNVDTALRHEVGHVLGLDHSAVLSAAMYPYVTSADVPAAFDSDDRIAIATAYPKVDPTLSGATLQGRVIGDHGGIFAAQVVAVNETGAPVATALTASTGDFTLSGIPAGRYRLYAEPLDGPVEVSALQGTWRQAKLTPFPTRFYDGPPLEVESGRVYGNLIVSTAGAVTLNPRWVGTASPTGQVTLTTSSVMVKAGQSVTIAVGGDGFTGGMTQFEVLNPAFRRVSDFSWSGNYVTARFVVEPGVPEQSAVILVRNGNESATLTGALRLQASSTNRVRSVRR